MLGEGIGGAFDAYSRRARLAPLLYTIAPAGLLCLVLIPQLRSWYRLVPAVVLLGTFVLLDQLGRDRGRRLQADLWRAWGGPPTTLALRHLNTDNAVLLARRHSQLAALTGRDLPTRRQEQQNQAKADQEYEAAVAYLRARTRNREQFPLVFAENCNYGFRRSMLGLRPIGLSIALITFAGSTAMLVLGSSGIVGVSILGTSISLALSVATVTLWWRIVTKSWVREIAEAYAERLLEAAEMMPSTAQVTPAAE